MQSNQAVANDQSDNVVPLSGPSGSKNGWIYENLRNLFDHFTQEKAETDERLAVIARQKTQTDARLEAIARERAETDTRLEKLDAKTQNLATSAERLIRETNTLTSSGELLSEELESVSASLEASLSDLGRRSDNTESGLASVSEQVEHIEAAARELDSRTATLVRRTLDLEAADKHLAEETHGLKSRIAEMEPRQQALEDSNRRLLRDTEVLTGKTGQLTDYFLKATWVTGGSVLVLAIAIGTTSWFSTSKIDEVSVGTNEQISEVRSDLTASIKRLEAAGPGGTAVEQQIGALQSQIDTKAASTVALEVETAELSEEVRRLATINEQFQGELGVIKDRMYAPDEPLRGTPIDMSSVRGTSWLKAQNPDHYVIQLVSVYRKQELAEFIAQYQQYLPLDQLSYSKTVHKGRDMYVLLFGTYGKFSEAIKKLETLPSALQKNRPYTRTFRGVQRRMS